MGLRNTVATAILGLIGLEVTPFKFVPVGTGATQLPNDEEAIANAIGSIINALGSKTTVWFETLADMGAAPGPAMKTVAFNAETSAVYEFFPGDATTVNGFTTVGNTGGTNGRWILRDSSITLRPNGVTDWTRMNAASAACGPAGIQIYMAGGTWLCDVPGVWVSGTHITRLPNVLIRSTLTPSGGQTASVIMLAPVTVSGAQTTLAANTVIGGTALSKNNVIPTVATVVVGNILVYGNGGINDLTQADVEAVSGAGPFSVTLSEVVRSVYSAGDTVFQYAVPSDIIFDGEWCEITGTGDLACEIIKGNRIYISKVRVTPRFGMFTSGIVWSQDVGSRDVTFEDIDIDAGNNASALVGMSAESGVRTRLVRCRVRRTGVGGQGIWFTVGDGSMVDCTSESNGTHGCLVETSAGLDISGCVFSKNGSIGCLIQNSSNVAIDAQCDDNVAGGLRTAASVVQIRNLTGARNANYVLRVDSGVVQAGLINSLAGLTWSVQAAGGVLVIDQLNSTGDANGLDVIGTADCTVTACRIYVTTPGGSYFYLDPGGTQKLVVSGLVDLTAGTGGPTVVNHASGAGSLVTLSNLVSVGTGTGGSKGYVGVAGSTVRRLNNVDLTSTATPWTVNAAGFANFGALLLTNGVGTFPWAAAAASDKTPNVQRVAPGGTLGTGGYKTVVNAGVGWVVTAIDLTGVTVVTDSSTMAVDVPC